MKYGTLQINSLALNCQNSISVDPFVCCGGFGFCSWGFFWGWVLFFFKLATLRALSNCGVWFFGWVGLVVFFFLNWPC